MSEYGILYEDETKAQIKWQKIIYTVGLKDNSLIRLESSTIRWINAKIPNILPSGHRIDFISTEFIPNGSRFNEIVISKGIQVKTAAFYGANVHKVAWPEDCKIIPDNCFSGSSLEEISNIHNVETIGEEAFGFSDIRDLIWPDKCETIPPRCFYSSKLQNMSNLNSVRRVCRRAFAHTPVECLDFSGSDDIYLEETSLAYLRDTCKVTLPYYVDQSSLTQAQKLI